MNVRVIDILNLMNHFDTVIIYTAIGDGLFKRLHKASVKEMKNSIYSNCKVITLDADTNEVSLTIENNEVAIVE